MFWPAWSVNLLCPQEGLRGQVRVLQQLEFNVMPGTSDDDDGKKVAIDEAGDGVRHCPVPYITLLQNHHPLDGHCLPQCIS